MCNGAEENPQVKIKWPKGLETTSVYGLPPSLLFLLLCTEFHRSENSGDGVDKKKRLFSFGNKDHNGLLGFLHHQRT